MIVKLEEGMTDPIPYETRIRQGKSLSFFLFYIITEEIMTVKNEIEWGPKS